MEGVVVIGGNGPLTGALGLSRLGLPVVGIAGQHVGGCLLVEWRHFRSFFHMASRLIDCA
jgi:hypothetical protein